MKPKTSFVADLPLNLGDQLLQHLKGQGYEISHPPYTVFQGKKKGATCTFYNSGKLVVQGKEAAPLIEFFIEPELLKSFKFTYENLGLDKTPRIGVDEAGKGDFFGPLCIAGVFAGEKEIDQLLKIGVRDSKKMQDGSISKLAKKIRELVPYHIVRIGPARYNEIYAKLRNLNQLLAWAHATTIAVLTEKTGCSTALIDQFTHLPLVENILKQKNLDIIFTQKTKGESDPVVAAASILARDCFVTELKNLSEHFGVDLLKGASRHVIEQGVKICRERGREVFPQISKIHFKTLDEILKMSEQ